MDPPKSGDESDLITEKIMGSDTTSQVASPQNAQQQPFEQYDPTMYYSEFW
jgi:hypothetical protein